MSNHQIASRLEFRLQCPSGAISRPLTIRCVCLCSSDLLSAGLFGVQCFAFALLTHCSVSLSPLFTVGSPEWCSLDQSPFPVVVFEVSIMNCQKVFQDFNSRFVNYRGCSDACLSACFPGCKLFGFSFFFFLSLQQIRSVHFVVIVFHSICLTTRQHHSHLMVAGVHSIVGMEITSNHRGHSWRPCLDLQSRVPTLGEFLHPLQVNADQSFTTATVAYVWATRLWQTRIRSPLLDIGIHTFDIHLTTLGGRLRVGTQERTRLWDGTLLLSQCTAVYLYRTSTGQIHLMELGRGIRPTLDSPLSRHHRCPLRAHLCRNSIPNPGSISRTTKSKLLHRNRIHPSRTTTVGLLCPPLLETGHPTRSTERFSPRSLSSYNHEAHLLSSHVTHWCAQSFPIRNTILQRDLPSRHGLLLRLHTALLYIINTDSHVLQLERRKSL